MHFLPRIVAAFLAERPGVQVELHSRSSEVLHEILLTHRYDVAIADLPVVYPGIKTEPITLECKCVVPAKHSLAKKRVIRPRDLAGVPLISLFREHAFTYQVANIFAAADVEWNVIAETRFFESACAFVAHGTGVAIVDAITASEHSGSGLLAKRFEPTVTFNIGLVYPPERPLGALLESFIELLKERIAPFLAQATAGPAKGH